MILDIPTTIGVIWLIHRTCSCSVNGDGGIEEDSAAALDVASIRVFKGYLETIYNETDEIDIH